jgi:hypothetical protein
MVYHANQIKRLSLTNAALVHRCGGSTLYANKNLALCFPFNRKHEHVCEHQNSAILKAERFGGKFNYFTEAVCVPKPADQTVW